MGIADQVIEEVRRSRRQMSEQCGHDPARLVELLQDANKRYAAQVRKYEKLHPPAPAEQDLP